MAADELSLHLTLAAVERSPAFVPAMTQWWNNLKKYSTRTA
jgi:hypothetical protein